MPFAASGSGGLQMLSGDDLILQYIKTYAADCDSDNPFQSDLGIGSQPIFANSADSAWKGQVRRKIEQMFRLYLERTNLARLRSLTFSVGEDGEDILDIKYLSIESDEDQSISLPIVAMVR